jgi:hypothetical protein
MARLFPDHSLELADWAGDPTLILRPPSSYEHFVDPLLGQGLAWWGQPTPPEMVNLSVRRFGSVLFALSDAWTLYGWSEALRNRTSGSVVVLHLDEHDDLMSPLLIRAGDQAWRDPLTGSGVELSDSGSVASAIASGAIGKASFILPLVFSPVEVHFRHLRGTADPRTPRRRHELERAWRYDPMLGGERPILVPAGADPQGRAPFVYNSTRFTDLWLEDLPDGPVLLHVDCDYLNNRYNGRTDWAVNPWGHDPSPADVERQVHSLLGSLDRAGIWPRVVDVTVSLSAGFFPAELWEPVGGLLATELNERMARR